MKTIYKYPMVQGLGHQTIMINENANILHVGFQGAELCLWAEVDMVENPLTEGVELITQGTGQAWQSSEAKLEYIGTAIGDIYVWHVYKLLPL